MPMHNAAATIEECIASLRDQSFEDFELILVDDGSQDEGAQRVRDLMLGDDRLRMLQPGRVGLVRALQLGLEACTAPWVARMDADDIADAERFAKQMAMAVDADADVVSCLVRCFSTGELGKGYATYETWINGLCDHESIVRERFVESPIAHPTVLFRRQAVVELGGYRDLDWAEDYDLWLRCAEAGLRFEKVPDVLVHWRDYPQRTSRVDGRYSNKAFLRCKARYMARGPLCETPVTIFGGRGVGGSLGRLLQEEGVDLRGFIDVDERRIGSQRCGVPVSGPGILGEIQEHVLVGAVGSRGARDLIRKHVSAAGWVEGHNFWCAA
jgi:glycosyltransferase involved in cell wall biosynthesis